jgi:hypothetical protein
MIITEPQLKVYILRFLTYVRNDIELAALSGTCSPAWVSSNGCERSHFLKMIRDAAHSGQRSHLLCHFDQREKSPHRMPRGWQGAAND